MSQELKEKIIAAGVSLAHNHKASGIVLVWAEFLRGSLKFSTAANCPTWKVDRDGVHVNPEWSADLTHQNIQFLICHETMHIALDHLGLAHELGIAQGGFILEGQEFNHRLLGIAEDAIINDALINDALGEFPAHKGGVLLTELQKAGYAGPKSSSELYFWLKEQTQDQAKAHEKAKKAIEKMLQRALESMEQEDQEGGGEGDKSDEAGDQQGKGPGSGQGSGAPQNGSGAPQQGDGSQPQAATAGCAPVSAPGKQDAEGNPKPMSRADIAAIQATLKEKLAGSGSHLEDLFTKPTEKRTRYKDVVRGGFARASTQALNRTLPSYSRASRRIGLDDGVSLPGRIGTESRIAFVADISGSMFDTLPRLIADILSVAQEYPDARVYLVTHTDRVVASAWLRNPRDTETIRNAMRETGGTYFLPAYEHVREVERAKGRFDAFIHFTDGYGEPNWPEPPGKQSIIALTMGQPHTVPPKRARVLFVS